MQQEDDSITDAGRRQLFKQAAAAAGALGLTSLVPGADAATPKPGDISNGDIWNTFCEELKKAGAQILRPEAPADTFNRAEG